MTPFAIGGVQMHVAARRDNVDGIGHRLDIFMARFPWTQTVRFNEPACYGPLHVPSQGSRAGLSLPTPLHYTDPASGTSGNVARFETPLTGKLASG